MKLNKSRQKIIFSGLFFAILAASLSAAVYFNDNAKLKSARPELLYGLTLADPLFYSPKIDAKKLEKSVEGLEKQEKLLRNDLLKKYPSGIKEMPERFTDDTKKYYTAYLANRGKTFLHPLEFLKLLPTIANYTEAFLKEKDPESGIKLLNNYEKAADAYGKAAMEQKELIETLMRNPAFARQHFVELSSATNLTMMLSDFVLIGKNAEKLREEIKKRKQCFYDGVCPPTPGSKTVSKSLVPEISALAKTAQIIPEELLQINKIPSEKIGPFFVKTKCFGNTKENLIPKQLMYIFLESPQKPDLVMPIFTPKLVNENFYYDLSFNPTILGKTLIQRGIKFYFQPEGANYLCADLGYWTDLALAATGDKLTYLPEMINTLANSLATLRKALWFDPLPMPSNLMAFFSDYSLGYMPFSESIWRIDEKPQYLEKEAARPITYKNYTELKKTYDDKTLKTFHFRLSDVRDELLKQTETSWRFWK